MTKMSAGRTRARRPLDAAIVALGLVTLGATWFAAAHHPIHRAEAKANRTVNELPEIARLLWPVMQLGSFAAIPAVAAAAFWRYRSPVISAQILAAGCGSWLFAKEIKELVGRGRPADHLEAVNVREEASGLGYVSGHSAVAMSLAMVLAPLLPVPVRWLAPVVAVLVAVGRVFFGAHLPLDVIGGAGLGAALGGTANLLAGVPSALAPKTAAASGVMRASPRDH